MRGLRVACLIARQLEAAASLESSLKQSCTMLTNLKDFNPQPAPAIVHEFSTACSSPFRFNEQAFPLTGLASTHLCVVRQVRFIAVQCVSGLVVPLNPFNLHNMRGS